MQSAYFRGWLQESPPRWGEHWGNDWERQRGGWDRWDHRNVPADAGYQPHDAAVKQAYQTQYQHGGPPPSQHAEASKPPAHAQQPAHAPEQGQGHQGKGDEQKPGQAPAQQKSHGQGQPQGSDQHQEHDK